jgi:hypothetical protein
MKGQWIGSYSGYTEGNMIINIDELTYCYQGYAFIHPTNSSLPSAATFIKTKDKSNQIELKQHLFAIHPANGSLVEYETIKQLFADDVYFISDVTVKVNYENDKLSIEWYAPDGKIGHAQIERNNPERSSDIAAKLIQWDDFKKAITDFIGGDFIFRGQNKPLRLRTSYHRTGRSDLLNFVHQDMPALLRYLTTKTSHFFNLQNPVENGALLYLAQHHGYPTPLLDWTYSPYVAAYFAFRSISNSDAANAKEDEYVRIYYFNHRLWHQNMRRIENILCPQLNLSVMEFVGIDNPRMMPQQSVTTITNVDDIEDYVMNNRVNGEEYLGAFDIRISERSNIVKELTFMGITTGSLFPGLDGVCGELKEKYFN